MAYITFIARDEYVASYQLGETVTLGRSFDSDIFIPDVFVSRHHCRFDLTDQGWIVMDLDSTNGIYFKGQRVKRRTLHEGDVLELGSIAFIFDENDMEIPESSVAAPFGPGAKIAELIDTVCAFDARPSEYVRQNVRKAKWKLLVPEPPVEEEPELVPLSEEQGEWTELDLEIQLVDAEVGQPMMVLVPRGESYAGMPTTGTAAMASSAIAASATPIPASPAGGGSFRQLAAAANAVGTDESAKLGPKQVKFWDEEPASSSKKSAKKEKKKKPKEVAVSEGPSLRERLDVLVEEIVYRSRSNPIVIASVVVVLLLAGVSGYWYANRDPYAGLQAKIRQMSAADRKQLDNASND